MSAATLATHDWMSIKAYCENKVSRKLSVLTNQKLVSFMCGLGLVGRAQPGPSGPGTLSAEPGLSAEEGTPWCIDMTAWELLGLTCEGEVGLDEDMSMVLLCDDEGVPGECRGPGDIENVVGILSPNLASNSLHTAKLRLMLSEEVHPDSVPNPALAAASEPLASS